MNKKNIDLTKAKDQLDKLKKTSKKVMETHGYTADAKKLLILEELIKEQLKNENINHSVG